MTDAAAAPSRMASGWGLASIHSSDHVLDTYFPSPRIGRADGSAAPSTLISAAVDDEARDVRTEVVHCEIDLDAPPLTTPDGLRGRVSGIYNLVFIGGGAIGGPTVGFLAQHFGARSALLLAGLIPAVATSTQSSARETAEHQPGWHLQLAA